MKINKIIQKQKERQLFGSIDQSVLSYSGHPKMFSTEQKVKAPILQDDMPPANGGTYSSKEDLDRKR